LIIIGITGIFKFIIIFIKVTYVCTALPSVRKCYWTDLDPGGQKLPTKIENVKKFNALNCWMFSFED
jgi:hypothetical protein